VFVEEAENWILEEDEVEDGQLANLCSLDHCPCLEQDYKGIIPAPRS